MKKNKGHVTDPIDEPLRVCALLVVGKVGFDIPPEGSAFQRVMRYSSNPSMVPVCTSRITGNTAATATDPHPANTGCSNLCQVICSRHYRKQPALLNRHYRGIHTIVNSSHARTWSMTMVVPVCTKRFDGQYSRQPELLNRQYTEGSLLYKIPPGR